MELVQSGDVERFGPDRLWDLYRRSFPRRRRTAATQQGMCRDGFDTVITDPRWTKLVLLERAAVDSLAGLSALTGDPSAMPAQALPAVAATWPEHVAAERLWYVPFLVVDPEYHHTGAATHLAGGIWTRAVAEGGIVMVDTAAFNDTAVRLPSALFHLARSIDPHATLQQVDGAGLWAYEFPEPVLV
jgi:ribosomal protein S18 acetylase RimI-like enzyme